MFCQEQGQSDGGKSLERVDQENRVSPALSQDAKNVRGSNISAASCANVSPRNPTGKIAGWKRSKQVPETRNGKRKEPHSDEKKGVRVIALANVAWAAREG